MATQSLDVALSRVRAALSGIYLPLPLLSAAPARELAERLTLQLDSYLLPRLDANEAPLLVVVGGSTGSGKSTLVNSLVGRAASPSSVLRPTTRVPHLFHNPKDTRWVADGRILPQLSRVNEMYGDNPWTLRLVADTAIPEGLLLLDAPDVDSVVADNRKLAEELLDAADVWLYVTTAVRYADAVPWEHLRAAVERNTMVALVLDRVPTEDLREVASYLRQMMVSGGLANSRLFTIAETELDANGLLPKLHISKIAKWLSVLVNDQIERQLAISQTLNGALQALTKNAPAVARGMDDQINSLDALRAEVIKVYKHSAQQIALHTLDGALLHGEVLSRWYEFVSTGEFIRAMERRIGALGNQITAAFRGAPKTADELGLAIEDGLVVLIKEQAEAAASKIKDIWVTHPAGEKLAANANWDIGRGSTRLLSRATETVRRWQADILQLVVAESQQRRVGVRFRAIGANGAGVTLMILVFSLATDGVDDEQAKPSGTAALAQRILEGIFGEAGVQQMARQCREDLLIRVDELMAAEQQRYFDLIGAQDVNPRQAAELRNALAAVNQARVIDERLRGVAL